MDFKEEVEKFMGEFGMCADMRGIIHSLDIEDSEGVPIQEYLEKVLREAYGEGRVDGQLSTDGPL
jgi:hypothetical protein